MKKYIGYGLVIGTLLLVGCSNKEAEPTEETKVSDGAEIIRIATTTSLFSSGLLEALEQDF